MIKLKRTWHELTDSAKIIVVAAAALLLIGITAAITFAASGMSSGNKNSTVPVGTDGCGGTVSCGAVPSTKPTTDPSVAFTYGQNMGRGLSISNFSNPAQFCSTHANSMYINDFPARSAYLQGCLAVLNGG